jgi:hypothetical protein
VTYDDPNIDIYCNDVDNANDFQTEQDVIERTRTSDSASWVANDIGKDAYKNSPSLVLPVQEVISRPGWSSGNNLVFLYIGKTDQNHAFRWNSVDVGSNPGGVYIEYEAGGALPIIMQKMNQFEGGSIL